MRSSSVADELCVPASLELVVVDVDDPIGRRIESLLITLDRFRQARYVNTLKKKRLEWRKKSFSKITNFQLEKICNQLKNDVFKPTNFSALTVCNQNSIHLILLKLTTVWFGKWNKIYHDLSHKYSFNPKFTLKLIRLPLNCDVHIFV